MEQINAIATVENEITATVSFDVTFKYENVIQNIIQGGSGQGGNVSSANMRWDKVIITSNPQTIVFRSGIGNPANPFSTTGWVISFPLCLDSTGAEVSPTITNRTVNGFDISIGDTSGTVEYISIE